jgi:hydroxyethylthiazole kinase-like uncharacterized protein yjeF
VENNEAQRAKAGIFLDPAARKEYYRWHGDPPRGEPADARQPENGHDHAAPVTMTEEITPSYAKLLLRDRPEDGHKGTFGHVFVVGGSRGFTGAVVMAAQAAARSGAGLVTAGVPRSLGDVVGAHLTVVMSRLLDDTPAESIAASALEPALDFVRDKQAAVLGPGLSQHPETREFALDFIRDCPVPLVIDADGLNCLSTHMCALKERGLPAVLTPHPGEMARLTGKSVEEVLANPEKLARDLAAPNNAVVVLKGPHTRVVSESRAWVCPRANSGLATGGTGDVLSGLIGGLLAQGMFAVDAAVLAVWVHAQAGQIAARRYTKRGMVATDVIECLPEAWKAVENGESA